MMFVKRKIAFMLGSRALASMVGVGAVLLSSGCASNDGQPSHEAAMISVGTVRLALETADARRYRLSDAVFDIEDDGGTLVATLRGDDDAGAQAITAELPQGDYTIRLASGWSLEGQTEDGSFAPVQAALLTQNPLPFRVSHAEVTELAYGFVTVEGTVTLGRGSLSVTVDVVSPARLDACNVLAPTGCASGLSCLLAGESGDTFCAQPGLLPVGAECSSEQCLAGAQCLRDPGQTTGVCKRFCDPNATNPFCECRSLSFDRNVGVCEGAPACEPNCAAAQVFTFSDSLGDDVAPTALADFFLGLPSVSATDYIRFEIVGGSGAGAWCAANAEFYVTTYLDNAASAGVVASGGWERYFRVEGGEWSEPDFASYSNYYGGNCSSQPFGWCSEWGLGGLSLAVEPASSNAESHTGSSWGGNGEVLSIAIAPDRLAACGF